MLIDCDTCAARNIHCGDCVVAVLLERRPATDLYEWTDDVPADRATIELDSAEESALGAFVSGGLLPPLRLVPTYRSPQADARPAGGNPEPISLHGAKSSGGRAATA